MALKNILSKFHVTLKIGIIIFLLGCSPFFIVLLADTLGLMDAGNAVGLGILIYISFWPSMILIAIGTIKTLRKRNALKSH